MNASGSLMRRARFEARRRLRQRRRACARLRGLTVADMGNETSIGLFLGFARETALLELRVKMHGPAVGVGAQFGVGRQRAERFENRHERLRRLKPARIQFDYFQWLPPRIPAARRLHRSAGLRSVTRTPIDV